jgi:hypothetical protein
LLTLISVLFGKTLASTFLPKLGEKLMQSYKQSLNQTGLESWPKLEEEGVEVLEGDPQQSGRIDWGNVEGPLAVGVWECTPGKCRLVNPFSEYCTVTKGRHSSFTLMPSESLNTTNEFAISISASGYTRTLRVVGGEVRSFTKSRHQRKSTHVVRASLLFPSPISSNTRVATSFAADMSTCHLRPQRSPRSRR